MSAQLTLPFPSEYFQAKPKQPSKGARQVYWLMFGMPSSRKGFCFPSQEYIAERLKRSVRTVIRWIQELVRFGILELRRRGPRSNEYRFLKSLEKSTVEKPVENTGHVRSSVISFGAASLCESANAEKSPSEIKADAILIAKDQIGDLELGGRRADQPLVVRLAKLLPTVDHWQRLRRNLREFSRRETVRGWGIIVRLAEQVSTL